MKTVTLAELAKCNWRRTKYEQTRECVEHPALTSTWVRRKDDPRDTITWFIGDEKRVLDGGNIDEIKAWAADALNRHYAGEK